MRWLLMPESVHALRSASSVLLRGAPLTAMMKVTVWAGFASINVRNVSRAVALDPSPLLGGYVMGCAALAAGAYRKSPSSASFSLLDTAWESGCTTFDTAAAYGGGQSERVLGNWMASRRARDEVVIVSKGGHPDAGASRLGPSALTSDLNGSLRRLRTDYVDLYMLHRDDPALPVGPIMETLHQFVQSGKVAAIGASNWTHTRIEAANQYAASLGLTPFTVSSPHMSLAEMYKAPWPGCISITGDAAAPARAWYTATQMPVLAWSPLSGGYLGDATSPSGSSAAYEGGDNAERRHRLRLLAYERGASPAQIALAYLRRQDMNVVPIVAASTPSRLRQLLDAGEWELSPEDTAWLDLRTAERGLEAG